MANANLRPNGTVLVQWAVVNATTAHEALDDAVTQPTAGSEADGYVAASTNNSTIDLDLGTVAVQSASQLVAWVEAGNTGGGDEDILLEIRNAAGTVLASVTYKPTVAYGWQSLTLGSQSWNQADVDGLRIACTSKKVGGGAQTEMRIRAVYGDLTYVAPATTHQVTASGGSSSSGSASARLVRAATATGASLTYGAATPHPALMATGDGTRNAVVDQDGGTTNLWQAVNRAPIGRENLEQVSPSTWIEPSVNVDGSVFLELTDVPADFLAWTQQPLYLAVMTNPSGTVGVDKVTLYAQVFAADETTPLTDELIIDAYGSGAVFDDPLFTVQGTPTRDDWNGARIRFRWEYVFGDEGLRLPLAAFWLTGPYSQPIDPNATASGASVSAGTATATRVVTVSASGASASSGSASATRVAQATASGASTSSGSAEARIVQIVGVLPDTIAASINLTGVVANIRDDPDSPDASYLTATDPALATSLRVTFEDPGGVLIGEQTFKILIRGRG